MKMAQMTKLQRKRIVALRAEKLAGKTTMTGIVVPRTGRLIALKYEVITKETAREIAAMPSVYTTIRDARRRGTIYQKNDLVEIGFICAS